MRSIWWQIGNLGTISAFPYRHKKTKKNLCENGRSQTFKILSSSPQSGIKSTHRKTAQIQHMFSWKRQHYSNLHIEISRLNISTYREDKHYYYTASAGRQCYSLQRSQYCRCSVLTVTNRNVFHTIEWNRRVRKTQKLINIYLLSPMITFSGRWRRIGRVTSRKGSKNIIFQIRQWNIIKCGWGIVTIHWLSHLYYN
jgi:hypothetical protein